jgi:hypothetical protein
MRKLCSDQHQNEDTRRKMETMASVVFRELVGKKQKSERLLKEKTMDDVNTSLDESYLSCHL